MVVTGRPTIPGGMISTPRAAKRAGRAYPGLDGVRALAATSVFLYHIGLRTHAFRSRGLSWIVLLDLGVDVFFVLSGFLIYRPYATAHLGKPQPVDLRGYARRRLLRIFPAYLVALVILRATGEIGMTGWLGYVKHLILTHTYFADQGGPGIGISWTLVVELSFYAFVPAWAFVIGRIAPRRHALAAEVVGASALIVLGFACRRWKLFGQLPIWATVLPPGFAALGIGMLFAVVSVAPDVSRLALMPRALGRIPAGLWWSAALIMFVGLAQLPMGFLSCGFCRTPNDAVIVHWVQPLIAACIAIPAIFGDSTRGLIRRWLQWKPVAYVGIVSYGVYLWHVYVIRLIPSSILRGTSLAAAVAALVGAFAAAVGIASVSYFVIERPAMRLGRRHDRVLGG